MTNKTPRKSEKWRAKYGALMTALSCFVTMIISWGHHWLLTIVLGLGVLVCGTIGIFDLRRIISERK